MTRKIKNCTITLSTLMILMILLSSSIANAQDCPNPDQTYNLKSQAEVDEFLATHPNCTYLSELELSGDINDISGFQSLTSVDYLYINDCPNLMDLSGFINLDSIYENLGFNGTEGITNLCGLNNLTFLGNDLRIEGTASIKNLDGLENLKRIGDDIRIEENQNLENINAIKNVDIFEGDNITIADNPSLSNCCGLQNIISIAVDISITIENNPSMCSSISDILEAICNYPVSECFVNTDDEVFINVVVYPNPTSNYLRIEHNEEKIIDRLVVYNSYGQAVLQVNDPSERVPIENLTNGLYVAEFKMGKLRELVKIVVQK